MGTVPSLAVRTPSACHLFVLVSGEMRFAHFTRHQHTHGERQSREHSCREQTESRHTLGKIWRFDGSQQDGHEQQKTLMLILLLIVLFSSLVVI